MIDAYVDGRPISRSSSSLTSEAWCSGPAGLVAWPSTVISSAVSASPSATCGRRRSRSSSSAFGSSAPSTYAFMKPWKVIVLPDALNSASRPSAARPPIFTVTEFPVASFIWEATVRFQMSS